MGSLLPACSSPVRRAQEQGDAPGTARDRLGGIWAPAGGECSGAAMERHATQMTACGFVAEQSEWQGPSALLIGDANVTLQLAATGRFLRAQTNLWPGYYTVPFRTRSFGTCPGRVLQYRSPRSRRWIPFMWQVAGRTRAVVAADCGTIMRRFTGSNLSTLPRAMSAPPSPYFETGEFLPYPDDFGFDSSAVEQPK